MVAFKSNNKVRKILQLFVYLLVFRRVKNIGNENYPLNRNSWLNKEHLSNYRSIS
jgi:hypothetical protein